MWEFLIGLGLGGVLIFVFITYYKNIKSIILDTISATRIANKWVRKKTVENRYEIIINGAIDTFNSNFEENIIPNCRIKWVNNKTDKSYLDELDGKAIVCLKFDKNDQDLNFFNATYSFTRTALLSNTREFVKPNSQKAIDLNLTKKFIKDYNRRALRIFNQTYNTEVQEVKEYFIKFEDTDKRGLFTTLLIPELYYLGENLSTATPSGKIEKEIEDFFDWFFELATRGKDERTVLNFKTENFKVGVILVANLETYQAYGIDAYTKWADKYASEQYGAVYLLARGNYRATILKEIVNELTNNKGFDQINKKASVFETDENGELIEVSCYCLKPNLAKIQYNAWEKIKQAYETKKTINGIVIAINDKKITVNIHGIPFDIQKEKLSNREIPVLNKFFHNEQELILNIESFDQEKCFVGLNNINTDTDPNILIETTLNENKSAKVSVLGIQFDNEGKERGLKTFCQSINKKVFIPKRYCSYSRFIRLETEFKKGDELTVTLHGFSMEFANFYGEIQGIENPENIISNFKVNQKYEATVQEITDNYITVELMPGLECRVFHSELSWDNSKKTKDYSIGEKISILLIRNDLNRFRLVGSIKRINKSVREEFYYEHKDSIMLAYILKTYENFGLSFKFAGYDHEGFVYVKELMWGFCSDISNSFPAGSSINVTPFDFDYHNNEIYYSIKKCYKNNFNELSDKLIIGERFNGKILKHFSDIARVEIDINEFSIQGYIHKSEISNVLFINSDDIKELLPVNKVFTFELKRKDNTNKIVELSRKKILEENLNKLKYGDIINVEIIKSESDEYYFYNNELEGLVTCKDDAISIGDKKEVYLVSSNYEFST